VKDTSRCETCNTADAIGPVAAEFRNTSAAASHRSRRNAANIAAADGSTNPPCKKTRRFIGKFPVVSGLDRKASLTPRRNARNGGNKTESELSKLVTFLGELRAAA
jgi:hypothetical protein